MWLTFLQLKSKQVVWLPTMLQTFFKKRTINRLESNGTTASITTLMFEKDNPNLQCTIVMFE